MMNYLQKNLLTYLIGIYMLLIPWDSYLVIEYSLPFFISYIFIVIVFLVYLSFMILNNLYTFTIPHYIFPLFVLLIYAVFSLVWTESIEVGIHEVGQLWVYFLIMILILLIAQSSKINIETVLWMYLIGTVSIGIYSIIINEGYEHYRFTIIDGYNPTWYSAYIVWALVASFVLFKNGNFLRRTVILSFDLILIFFLLLTQGRNSIMALFVSMILVLIINFTGIKTKEKRIDIIISKRYIKIILYVLVASFFITAIIYNTGLNEQLTRIGNLKELFGGDSDLATAGRTSIWANYLDGKMGGFIIGSGIGSSLSSFKNMYMMNLTSIETHNAYLLSFIEFGLFGLFLWLSFLWLITKFSFKNKENRSYLIWLSFIFIFMSIGNDTLTYRYWWAGLTVFVLISHLQKSNNSYKYSSTR